MKKDRLKYIVGKMEVKVLFLTFIIYHLSFIISFAQEIKVSAKADVSTIKIGEQTKLHLRAEAPVDVKIKFPVIPDTITKIQILNRGKIDTVKSADGKQISYDQPITITAFDSGYYPIPPFVFQYTRNGKTGIDSVMTEAILFSVHTVPVDTSLAIKAIKAPLDIPLSFMEMLPYILIGLAVIILVIVIIILVRRAKRKKSGVKVFVPKRPAHEIAIEELRKLESEKVWQAGDYKKYHSRVSDIIRTYIENRFRTMAMESTTDEILNSFKGKALEPLAKEKLKYLLQIADLVKFAKVQAIASENELSLANAYDFIEMTKPQLVPQTEKKEETVS